MNKTLTIDDLVDALEKNVFHGRLPPFPDMIVKAVVQSVPCFKTAGEAETQQLIKALHRAISLRLDAHRANDRAPFLN